MRFCVYFQIPWILTWNIQIKETEDQIKHVFKTIKIKWWDNYTYTHVDIKAVKVWLFENGHLQDLYKKRTSEFLNSKSKLLVALAQTTSEADFQKLLQEATSVGSTSSPSIVEEEDEDTIYDLNDPFLDSQPPL